MTKFSKCHRIALAFGLVVALSAGAANAGSIEVDLTVSQGGNSASFAITLGNYDSPGTTPNNLTADVNLINTVLTLSGLGNVSFTSLGASSNNQGDTQALISQNALFSIAPTTDPNALPVIITALAFQTDFTSPTGGVGSLLSSASGTFSTATATSTQSFQSWFDQTNSGAMSTPSGPLNFTYNDPNDLSKSGTTSAGIPGVVSPYALVNQISLSVGGAPVQTGVSYGGTTILTVTAVPEPASVVMIMSALPVVFGLSRLRRRGV